MIDVDSPSIDSLQTLLMLSQAFFANGCGKKAYMTLGIPFSHENDPDHY